MVQTPTKLHLVNKWTISEMSSMDIDEEVSSKRINMDQQNDIVDLEEKILTNSGENALF